jgi:hypothetical protein
MVSAASLMSLRSVELSFFCGVKPCAEKQNTIVQINIPVSFFIKMFNLETAFFKISLAKTFNNK